MIVNATFLRNNSNTVGGFTKKSLLVEADVRGHLASITSQSQLSRFGGFISSEYAFSAKNTLFIPQVGDFVRVEDAWFVVDKADVDRYNRRFNVFLQLTQAPKEA